MADDKIYVGQRVLVTVSLFDRVRGEQAAGLIPTLQLVRPDRTFVNVGPMAEDAGEVGIYFATGIVDVDGSWYAQVSVPAPLETIARGDKFYVNT